MLCMCIILSVLLQLTFCVFNSEWFRSVIGFHNMEHVNGALLLNLNLLVSAHANVSSVFPILMSQHVFKTLYHIFFFFTVVL